MALLISWKLSSFLIFNLKGSCSTSVWKSNSAQPVFCLRPNFGYSILGSVDWMGPASTWWLLMLTIVWDTDWNPILMLPSSWPIVVLYSIWSHSTWYNSAAKMGCLIHSLNLLVLTKIMGMTLALGIAMHLLTMMPNGKLLCSAYSTRNMVLCGNSLVHPGVVIAEFLGIPVDCCLLPIVTWPISPSLLIKCGQAFF